jgi:hypothetical protein
VACSPPSQRRKRSSARTDCCSRVLSNTASWFLPVKLISHSLVSIFLPLLALWDSRTATREVRVRVRVRVRAREREPSELIESSNRINHGGMGENSLTTDNNFHRQVALIWIGFCSAVLVLSETVLVLVIESHL